MFYIFEFAFSFKKKLFWNGPATFSRETLLPDFQVDGLLFYINYIRSARCFVPT